RAERKELLRLQSDEMRFEIADPGNKSHPQPSGSTGPRTEEGKRRSRRNAARHGIFAKIVLSGDHFQESVEDYKKLHRVLRKAKRPVGAFEETLVEQLAFEFLRLARLYKADAQVAPLIFERVVKTLSEGHAL